MVLTVFNPIVLIGKMYFYQNTHEKEYAHWRIVVGQG